MCTEFVRNNDLKIGGILEKKKLFYGNRKIDRLDGCVCVKFLDFLSDN